MLFVVDQKLLPLFEKLLLTLIQFLQQNFQAIFFHHFSFFNQPHQNENKINENKGLDIRPRSGIWMELEVHMPQVLHQRDACWIQVQEVVLTLWGEPRAVTSHDVVMSLP